MPRLAIALCAALAAPPAVAQGTDPLELRVMSFNIWYGGVQVDFDQVIATLIAADADIVGLQEPDGQTARIAELAGYPYVDTRRHILSRVPLFDSGLGQRTETGQSPYSLAGLDSDAVHAWAMIAPGQVVAIANLHLTSDPYGPTVARDGGTLEEILATETATRLPEIEPLIAALAPIVADGIPTIVTGDFNSPSHLDWTAARLGTLPQITMEVPWPVTSAMQAAGFTDSFRAVHPDPVSRPGITYSPGFPHPVQQEGEVHDRIDYIFAANATPLASETWGEAGNPDVDHAMTPWPSDHRAVVTTFSVTPVTAPALIATEPRLVSEGDTFLVRVNSPDRADWSAAIVPRGGDPSTDTLTSVEGVATYWQSALRFSTFRLPPGPYDAVLLSPDGAELARTMFSILPRGGTATLSVLTPSVPAGQGITVAWSGAPGLRFDWLGIYAAGDPSVYNYLAFAYTGATLEGEMTLTPDLYYDDLPPGDYEIRLMADDHYVTLAAAPFTVTAE
jgi:endonuclease/exonuclease/phosphatase family metal-dependent hydrolase